MRIINGFLVVLMMASWAWGSHLGHVDLSRMDRIFQDTQNAFSFFYDRRSGNYYIQYSDLEEGQEEIALFEPTNKISPAINVVIARDGSSLFKYVYGISNGLAAKQRLVAFEFEIPRAFVKDMDAPLVWRSDLDDREDGKIGWFNLNFIESFFGLGPGESKGGFEIKADLLPGVITASFEGAKVEKNADGDLLSNWFPIEPTGELDKAQRIYIENDTNEFAFRKTVGPKVIAPSQPAVICDTFILDLIGQLREAVALGWIKHDLRKDRDDDDDHGKRKGDEKGKKKGHEKDDDEGEDNGDDDDEMDDADKNQPGAVPSEIRDILSRSGDDALPGIAKSIIQKLTKVRRECLRGKFGSAREKLRGLIKQVNAQRGNHLTEEAHALIKFNAEFLLEKI